MAKYLVVLIVVVLVLWLMFGRRRRDEPPHGRGATRGAPEGMARCAHCGVHLPRSEALLLGGRTYCSAAHRDAGPRDDA